MNGPMWTGWRLWGVRLMLLSSAAAVAGPKSGDVADGSHGQYVHVLGLYPEGDRIHRGAKLTASDSRPLSLRRTCNPCHDVNTIAGGRHFNAMDPNAWTGRPGEPWIYADARLAMQIPLSYRPWLGTWRPETLGLDPEAFMRHFGRHHPGAGLASGTLAVNCLIWICHLDDPRMAPGAVDGMADQARQGRFAEAVTVTWPGARLDAAGQTLTYDRDAFDDHNDVFLNLTKDIAARRCWTCHSRVPVGGADAPGHMVDRDVHLESGMTCVACHRHGPDHRMSRGYAEEALAPQRTWAGELTCAGCHMEAPGAPRPRAGRLGAPIPAHRGLPAVHFEKLTCTVCHSGPWPEARVGHVKTSRSHALGTTYARKAGDALPRIQYPVYARRPDGRIAPAHLVWPAFWGSLQGERVTPLPLAVIESPLRRVIRRSLVPRSQAWPALTREHVTRALTALADTADVTGTPVYICGGRLYRLGRDGTLVTDIDEAAQPCLWPGAHAVRPARQALGVRGCRDCHDPESPFFYAAAPVDSPLVEDRDRTLAMVAWQFHDPAVPRIFGWTFRGRGWLKASLIGAALVLAGLVWIAMQRVGLRLLRALSGGEC
jgi:hypothetical protein